jgi:hypothetical protein
VSVNPGLLVILEDKVNLMLCCIRLGILKELELHNLFHFGHILLRFMVR